MLIGDNQLMAIALGQTKMSQIITQIDRETTDKLTYIQQQTNQELPEILSAAIN